jgi:hypothetical protein
LKADGSNQQYLVFRGISPTDLAKLDRVRPKYTRVTYHKDINLLIIKLMPTAKHEAAHVNFSRRIDYKIYGMGMSASDLEGTGATRFEGSSTSKEGDSSFKPPCRDNDDDLPTIVIESGYSEPLERLQSGAKWWLASSKKPTGGGVMKVMIVVIISIKKEKKSLQIEKWENVPQDPGRPVTRANGPVPTLVHEITISSNAGTSTPNQVTGAPLVLQYEKIFLRDPIPPQTDLIFTANDLADFATKLWMHFK